MNANKEKGSPPVHPLSATVTIVLDLLWALPEIAETETVVGIPLVIPTMLGAGLTCWLAVMLVERFVAKGDWGAAVAKGLVMGIIAGVPYAVLGTVVGASLLAWAGIKRLRSKP